MNINGTISSSKRPFIHMTAAAIGNIVSSFVFVPKEAVKSQMQAIRTGSIIWHGSSSSLSSTFSTINSNDKLFSFSLLVDSGFWLVFLFLFSR